MTDTEVEVWIAVNADADYSVGHDKDTAEENFGNEFSNGGAYKLIQLKLTIPTPEPLVLTAVIPDQSGEVTLKVQQ